MFFDVFFFFLMGGKHPDCGTEKQTAPFKQPPRCFRELREENTAAQNGGHAALKVQVFCFCNQVQDILIFFVSFFSVFFAIV